MSGEQVVSDMHHIELGWETNSEIDFVLMTCVNDIIQRLSQSLYSCYDTQHSWTKSIAPCIGLCSYLKQRLTWQSNVFVHVPKTRFALLVWRVVFVCKIIQLTQISGDQEQAIMIGVTIKRFPTIRARATACAPKAGRGQNAWNLVFFAHGARMVVCTIVHSAYHTWGSTHAAL